MKYNINIVTEMIAWEAKNFKAEYDKAVSEKENALKELKENLVQGTTLFKQKQTEIEENFTRTIARLRTEAANHVMPDVEALRQQEHERVAKISTGSLLRLRDVSEIPMTALELGVIAEEIGENDYWAHRVLVGIAEKNGINPAELHLESSLDVKENVLDQLIDQFDKILALYPSGGHDELEARNVRHLYLNDSIIRRAKEIYSGKIGKESDEQLAQTAFLNVKAQQTEISRGVAINNALRNTKGAVRNSLLCRLAEDGSISDIAIELSGRSAEIMDFRNNGKAKEYREAERAMEDIKSCPDRDFIVNILTQNSSNGFLTEMYQKELKNNDSLADIMSGESPTAAAAATT